MIAQFEDADSSAWPSSKFFLFY